MLENTQSHRTLRSPYTTVGTLQPIAEASKGAGTLVKPDGRSRSVSLGAIPSVVSGRASKIPSPTVSLNEGRESPKPMIGRVSPGDNNARELRRALSPFKGTSAEVLRRLDEETF